MSDFYPTLTDRIIEKLKDIFEDTFKMYFDEDPIAIGKSQLPAIVVEQATGNVTAGPTGLDRSTEVIQITIITNKRNDFGASNEINETKTQLKRWVASRDATTGLWTDKSLLGIIRKNFTLDGVVVGQEIAIDYEISARPNTNTQEKEGILTSEAYIRLTATELVEVQSRS